MGRRKGFVATVAKAARDAERERLRQQRAQAQASARATRELEARRKAYEKAKAADEKERKRLYGEARSAEVDVLNEQLDDLVAELGSILHSTLDVDDHLDFESLKTDVPAIPFDPGPLGHAEPPPRPPVVQPLSALTKLLPGAKDKQVLRETAASQEHQHAIALHQQREAQRLQALEAARLAHEADVAQQVAEIEERNAEIDEFREQFESGDRDRVTEYFQLVLMASVYPDGFPQKMKLSYSPESRQLAIEYDLPTLDVIPAVAKHKYVKTKDEITSTARPATQRRDLYTSIVAQITLRTIHEVFEADRTNKIDTVVFNGHVATVDPGTGMDIHPCLVTVRTTKDLFGGLDLSRVEPIACLKTLSASVSKNPSELVPVRPVLDFSMVDPRFVQESDVLSTLDQRPNLMELTPGEFESLITNLFEKMGLETRLTQASRDGGVDCVAYNTDPVLGGKVVIQAKRYKHTVGVSAVRDLFGTVQNEGASKGILVTTSGYGKASFEFANNKPLELFDGSHLLHLLAKHTGMEAKIEPPEDWKDPQADSGEVAG